MDKTKWITLVVLVLGVGSFAAIAADTSKAFDEMDHDGDGYISRSEATTRVDLRESWREVDVDQDGQLTEAEFAAFEIVPREPYPEE